MNRALTIAAATLLLVLSVGATVAAAGDITTTGNAQFGKWKYDQVTAEDSYLDVAISRDLVRRVSAGFVDNRAYRELWVLGNPALDGIYRFDKAPADSFYREQAFTVDNVAKSFFSGNSKLAFRSGDKLSRRIIVLKATHKHVADEKCSILIYAGNDRGTVVYLDLFNNYFVLSLFCYRGLSDTELLAVAYARALAFGKDGRPQVRADGAALPTVDPALKAKFVTGTQAGAAAEDTYAGRTAFAIRFDWQGVSENATGTLAVDTSGTAGSLRAELGGDVGTCTGRWQRNSDPEEPVAQSAGIWQLSCPDGLAAAGDYAMTTARTGTATGTDNRDRTIRFTFGEK